MSIFPIMLGLACFAAINYFTTDASPEDSPIGITTFSTFERQAINLSISGGITMSPPPLVKLESCHRNEHYDESTEYWDISIIVHKEILQRFRLMLMGHLSIQRFGRPERYHMWRIPLHARARHILLFVLLSQVLSKIGWQENGNLQCMNWLDKHRLRRRSPGRKISPSVEETSALLWLRIEGFDPLPDLQDSRPSCRIMQRRQILNHLAG